MRNGLLASVAHGPMLHVARIPLYRRRSAVARAVQEAGMNVEHVPCLPYRSIV